MAEDLLNCSQVGTALEKVGRHGVAQTMRAEVGRIWHSGQGSMHDPAHDPGIDPVAAVTDEQRPFSRIGELRSIVGPRVHGAKSRAPQRHSPFFVPLAEDAKRAALTIDVSKVDPAEFRHPDAAGVQRLEDRGVPEQCSAIRGGGRRSGLGQTFEQTPRCLLIESLRQAPLLFRSAQLRSRIERSQIGALRPCEEHTRGRRPALHSRTTGTRSLLRREPSAQLADLHIAERANVVRLKVRKEIRQIR